MGEKLGGLRGGVPPPRTHPCRCRHERQSAQKSLDCSQCFVMCTALLRVMMLSRAKTIANTRGTARKACVSDRVHPQADADAGMTTVTCHMDTSPTRPALAALEAATTKPIIDVSSVTHC